MNHGTDMQQRWGEAWKAWRGLLRKRERIGEAPAITHTTVRTFRLIHSQVSLLIDSIVTHSRLPVLPLGCDT